MRREFWLNTYIEDGAEIVSEFLREKPDFATDYHVREVLPGEDDMIKELVAALKDIEMAPRILNKSVEHKMQHMAAEALSKYKVFMDGNE